ncbi:hypothetical protein LCGC14_0220110 [marine sediment metagenome]|uniref:Uncharacterized protein n=1 Tax=marine sediment metagenome TaxID=412755 RepID=A0A0F9WXJ7_9ZZZZ
MLEWVICIVVVIAIVFFICDRFKGPGMGL